MFFSGLCPLIKDSGGNLSDVSFVRRSEESESEPAQTADLNDSRKANVAADKDYRFYALRDIKAGEELTSDYRTYSNQP
jgi:SET domain-containing protein